jgi:large subunit ribosomal protein L32
MPVPKKKQSRSRRDKRRSQNSKYTPRSMARCSRCGAPRLPHRACPECGFYKDRIVLEVQTEKK